MSSTTHFSLSVLCVLLVATVPSTVSASCSSSLDCSLNGECSSAGVCECDIAWTGPTCNQMDLDPTPTVAYGMGGVNGLMSSWGGGPPVKDPKTGLYTLLVTEIAGHCGMSAWSHMSQAAIAVSSSPEGPYKRVGLAVGTQTHNTYYAYSPVDDLHLLYSIFDGASPESCQPYWPCTNGTTPGGHGLRPPSPWPKGTCPPVNGAHLHYAKSLDGPWLSAGKINVSAPGAPPQAGSSNPAPYIFENGTVLMLGRGKDGTTFPNGTRVINHNVFLYRADSWNSTYHWVPSNGVNGAVAIGNGKIPTEDPTLYKGRRGFHVLLHSAADLTHGWSEDGLTWYWSPDLTGPTHPATCPTCGNERPRVHLDENGDIAVVFVGRELGPGTLDAAQTAAFVPAKKN